MENAAYQEVRPPGSDGRAPSSSGYSAQEPGLPPRVVGLLDGHFVYGDGHGGYAVEINGFLRPLPVAAKDKIIVFAHVQNGLMNHVSDGDVAMAEDSDDDAPMARDPLISPPIRLRLKEKKRSIRDYKGKPLKIIVTGEPGVGKTTFCNHSRSIMSAKGSHGRYVEYSHTAPGSHSGSVTSLFETYMLGGNERVCLQDGKGLEIEDGDLGLLKLNLEGRMKDNFNMKLGCEGIKDMYFNKGLGKKLTREEENAMSLLRSGDDDDPQLEAYRPKASEESISAFPSPASLTLPERDGGERVEGGSQTWRLGLHYANGANGPTESQLTFLEALTPHLKEAFVKQGVCLEVLTDNPDHLMGIVICRDYTSRTEIRAFSQAILSGFTAHAEALGLSDGAVDTESLAQCPYACLPIWFVTVWTTKPDSQPGIPLNVAKDISRAWPHGPVYDHVIRRNRDGTLHMADLPRHFFDRIAETAVSEERRRNHQKVGARLWCAA
uniref:Uncharacterized protein n=1 Tax=Vitrella brassicaformis TaxID=1169539 RepID=A0A7S1P094_9ALVE